MNARLKQHARSLLQRLAPAGSWRQRVRFRLTRFVRRLLLPRRPRIVPPLPDLDDPAAIARYLAIFDLAPPTEAGSSDRVYHWLDFRPHVWTMFPLATTPAQLPTFVAWLLSNWQRLAAARLLRSSRAAEPAPTSNPLVDAAMTPSPLQQPGCDPARHDDFARDSSRAATPLQIADVLAFVRELTHDPSRGLEPLYRRSIAWQQSAPNESAPNEWSTPPKEPGVNLLAHFCYPSGLQVAALNTKEALENAGWHVSCRDVPNNAAADLPTRRHFLGLHPHPITIVQVAPEPLGRNAYFMAGLAERPKTYRIGYWYWELDQVPARWKRQRDWLNELWAPTRFVGDALRSTMPMRVVDMLPGMRMPPVVDVPRSRFGITEGRFVFLFAFDMSSTCERKNPGAVVMAFRKAFAPGEPVTLVIKVSRAWEDPPAFADLQRAAEPERIIVIDDVLPANDYFGLMNCCDAYVSLHRSEGFGLTLAEAMALGKPTIATGYSGNLAFMDETNSLLVAYELTTLRRSVKSYPRGTRWAEPFVDDAAAKMRWLLENPVAARAIADRGQASVRDLLSLEAAAERMTKRLREISGAVFERSPLSPGTPGERGRG